MINHLIIGAKEQYSPILETIVLCLRFHAAGE